MNKIDFDSQGYEYVCERYSELLTLEKELAVELKETKEQLLKMAGGERMENGLKIEKMAGRKTINYKQMVEDLGLSDELVKTYEKVGEDYWKITKY